MKKNLIWIGIVITICTGCNQAQQKSSASTSLATKKSVQPLTSFNIYYPNVQKIKQPDPMSCWAAAVTMLYSYKMGQQNLKIVDVLHPLGQLYVDIFNSGKGISATQEQSLYQKIPLNVIKGQNPTIAYWKQILESHGPLSVTVDAAPGQGLIHALVVTGLKGDGSPANTSITYIDPAYGKEYEKAFLDFLKLYEGSSSWPLQIIYW